MVLRLLIFILCLTAMNVFSQTPTIETGVSQPLAKWRAANYSDVRYKLNLTLEKMSPTLKGTIEISVKNNADQIVLDWRKLRGKEDLSSVTNVFVNGKAAKFEEINEHLVFKDGVVKGENVVKLDFTSPILTSGGAITRYVDKEDGAEYVYSLFVPSDASTAFPVFDQPDLKARFQLSVKTSWNWKVISNAELQEIQPLPMSHSEDWNKNLATINFKETKPISTYVFAFAAGDFTVFNESEFSKELTSFSEPREKLNLTIARNKGSSVPNLNTVTAGAEIYVRKSQAEKFKPHAAETFRLNREAVKYLESYFDYKFPFPKYDLVLIPEFPFGGMEHAGATFLREDRVIFPTEPTKNDFVTRANLIFHEAAHQWFGDTVTMRWFDDLWLKEGFAEFMAYKTLEKVMPEYNSWKIFYERNKQAAYLTDSTKGTTPIYQEIPNLSAAKSAYGNIVYRKAPSFLKQAEFYLGADKFQTAVRAFLKKHQFANAEWTDLVKEFEDAAWFSSMAFYHSSDAENVTKETEERQRKYIRDWADSWIKQAGVPIIKVVANQGKSVLYDNADALSFELKELNSENPRWKQDTKMYVRISVNPPKIFNRSIPPGWGEAQTLSPVTYHNIPQNADVLIFPNYQDYGYGIFLLDEKSRDYVQKNIQNERDDFLRTMMWGSLWDSVREAELAPKDYVELVIKNINVETDESTIQTLLNRVSTAMNYYLSDAQRDELAPRLENVLLDRLAKAATSGQRITFYRALLNAASTEATKKTLKDIFINNGKISVAVDVETKMEIDAIRLVDISLSLKTKDRFDIVTKLLTLNDANAPRMLAELEKTEKSDEAKRYAYAARAGIGTAENKAKFWTDFTGNKELSESWIESAFVAFNSTRHSELTLPYLEKSLAELPNLKRSRKIFFVNGWLAAFISGQRSEQALGIVNKFLADNPNLDKDLRLKILENADGLERAVKIRQRFSEK